MLTFQGHKHLKTWLLHHPQGQTMLKQLLREIPTGLLALAYEDRVALYGAAWQSLTVVDMINTDSGEAEQLAEQIAELRLPAKQRDWFWPGRATPDRPGHLGTVPVSRLTVSQAAQLEADTAFFKALEAI